MQYLNIETTIFDRPEFVGCDPTEQATWLKLAGFCSKMENGGVIENCGGWKNRKWEQIVRVTMAEIRARNDLWTYDGNSLTVHFYPCHQERALKRMREQRIQAGIASGHSRRSKPR
jgi:hypothetical protein